jgi:hypothetical protein
LGYSINIERGRRAARLVVRIEYKVLLENVDEPRNKNDGAKLSDHFAIADQVDMHDKFVESCCNSR